MILSEIMTRYTWVVCSNLLPSCFWKNRSASTSATKICLRRLSRTAVPYARLSATGTTSVWNF